MTDGLHITGGFGGTVARLEDLHRAAGALRVAADRLDAAAELLAAAARSSWRGADPFVAGGNVRGALEPVVGGPSAPGAAAERLRSLARALVEAASGYAQAESTATSLVHGLVGLLGTAIGESPLAPVLELGLAANGLIVAGAGTLLAHQVTGRWPAQTAISGHVAEPLLGGVASVLRARQPGLQLPVARPVGPSIAPVGQLLADRPLLVVPALGGSRTLTGAAVPASDGDVMRMVRDAYDTHGAPPGEVVVTALAHPDGSRSWIVAVPGTESWTVGGGNPFDLQSNLELLGGQPAAASDLALAAMERAGIPPGEPVLLAGHSQGGMTAMALAGSAAVTSRFTITHVLTAGSPVAGMTTQPGVQVLSAEHSDDLVPALDGRGNPDTPSRVTVVRDLAASPDPAVRSARLTITGAHDVDLYARTLDVVDAAAATDPSLQAWDASTSARIFGADGTTATSTSYLGLAGVDVPHLTQGRG